MGRAITDWALVEAGLMKVIAALSDDPVSIALGFFSIENFRSKLKFADVIIKFHIKEDATRKLWVNIFDKLDRAATRRNHLAHRKVRHDPAQKAGRRYALVEWLAPTVKSRRKNEEKKPVLSGALYVREVIAIRAQFAWVSQALDNFLLAFVGKEQPPEFDEPPMGPMGLRTISAQIRAALELPLKPLRKKRPPKK